MKQIAALWLAAPLALAACGGVATTPAPAAPTQKATARVTASKPVLTPEQRAEERLLQNMVQSSQAPSSNGTEILAFAKTARRDGSTPRAQVDPVSFRVADLPLAKLPEILAAAASPRVLPDGDEPSELYLDWRGVDPGKARPAWTTVRVSLKDATLGRIRIGANEAPISSGAGGGVYVTCGGEATGRPPAITPARWETLTAGPGGAARFTVVDAWFDAHTCKASLVRRTSVDARAIAGGVLYGFRETCVPSPALDPSVPSAMPAPVACSPGESLTLLGPRLQHVVATGVGGDARTSLGSFSRITLPLRRGGGGSLVERIAASSLREWYDGSGSRASFSQDILLGVEVMQAVDDPEPIAVAYVSEGT